MTNALADHSPEMLVRYARKCYDAATRMHRSMPTEDAEKVLRACATALRYAAERYSGEPHASFVFTAKEMNAARDMVNWLRAKRNEEAFSW